MSEPDTSKKSRLRQLAEEKNDFGDHGHDSQAGVPAEAAHGEGAVVVKGNPQPFKGTAGGK